MDQKGIFLKYLIIFNKNKDIFLFYLSFIFKLTNWKRIFCYFQTKMINIIFT